MNLDAFGRFAVAYDLRRQFVRGRTPAVAAICIVGAALLAVGCSSNSSSSSASASALPTTASPAQSATVAPAPPAPSDPAHPATSAPASPVSGTATCTVSVLSFALGAKTGAAGQQMTQVVDLTNKGSAACAMKGFPGVDLVGVAKGQLNYSWSLARSSARYVRVTLQPGGTAHFDLIYLPYASGDGIEFTVIKLVLTPPNTFTQAQVTWSQAVLLQDGATHPGTFIGPVVAGA
jgi:hypothetical protein